uniref:Umc1048 n=1 Tax=Arundo donax TaxID=35708 RepID=A0A0A9BCY2_ARUDO
MRILTNRHRSASLIRYITRMWTKCLVLSVWMSSTRHGAQCLFFRTMFLQI